MASQGRRGDDGRLVVADVDGTLVTPYKVLTPRARAVVRAITDGGIAFRITSGRPLLGMDTLIDDLDLRDQIAASNGGLIVRPDLSIMRGDISAKHLSRAEAWSADFNDAALRRRCPISI